ncbi:MAG: exosortase/archaeosortase family protein [Lentisphaeria bacterium]|nr:exosortase/archaeosortase family protein [Lentisphaeria bacterium]
MIELKKALAPLKKDWKCTAIFAIAFVFACWQSAYQIRSEWGGAAALLILLACLLYLAAKASADAPEKKCFPWHKILAWPPVLIALGLLFLPWSNPDAPGFKFGAWFFLALGAVCFFSGVRAMVYGSVPLLGCFLAVPFRESIVLYLSYPFRMVSTVLSVGFLQLFGMHIENDNTTIRIEGLDIAITDACSGIQQFEAMILVAFWLVMIWKRPFIWRCIHYLFLIPSIIMANAVRIVLTIALYKVGFTAVLNNTWHEGLGYAQVVLTVAFFFLVGCLLPEDNDNISSGKTKENGNDGAKKKAGKGDKMHE